MNVENKNFVITGASQGIGKEVARLLALKGANVCLIARNQARLNAAKKDIEKAASSNVEIMTLAIDVSNKIQVKKAAKEIKSKWKTIHGLLNIAGFAYPGEFLEIPLEKFEQINAVKYLGSVYMSQAFVPLIEDSGYLGFTSSVLGYMGLYGYSAYVGPSFALFGLAETLETELMHRNIHVSVLCPADTKTPGFDEEEKTKPYVTQKISETAKIMEPIEVAQTYLNKLSKKKFVITVNFESAMLYRLFGILPGLARWIMRGMVKKHKK